MTGLVAALLLSVAAPRPLLFVHVMPWFEADGGKLGWHWTMNRPELAGKGVASHFRPLTGPYDSKDPAILELQCAWMKLAGFDGVLADWYGTQPHFDYPMIHARTQALFDAAERFGLKIGVVYEDQTVRNAIREKLIGPERAIPIARETGEFLGREWFKRPGWWRLGGRPVVMVFGPQHFGEAEWSAFRAGSGPIRLLTLHDPRAYSDGAYDWPVPSKGLAFNREFGARSAGWRVRVPVAFPRFRDWYEEGGQTGYPDLPDDNGRTYRDTLGRALALNPPAVQVATWNDWQEGTQIEPSVEVGTRDLVATQDARRRLDPGFAYRPADLDLPLKLYRLRRETPERKGLDEAAEALRKGDVAAARRALDER